MTEATKPNFAFQAVLVDPKKNYQVIAFRGELDKAALQVEENRLEDLVSQLKPPYIVLDFANLTFINSEGIGFVMTLYAHLTKIKKKLAIVAAKSHVKDVLLAIGVGSIVSCYDTLAEFEHKHPS